MADIGPEVLPRLSIGGRSESTGRNGELKVVAGKHQSQQQQLQIRHELPIHSKQQNNISLNDEDDSVTVNDSNNGTSSRRGSFSMEGMSEFARPRTPRSKAELDAMLKGLELSIETLPDRPRPKPLEFRGKLKASVRIERIQRYISSLEYNHTGTKYFSVRKDRGPKKLAVTAREIMRECLPIKCIEAVFLGFYLTINMKDLVRFPIRFQSSMENGRYRFKHIVMAVSHEGTWAAIGLSRKHTLMYKPLKFPSLSSLLKDFRDSYEALGHELDHVGVGLPFGHDEHSVEPIHWRPLMIHFSNENPWDDLTDKALDTFVMKLDTIEPHVKSNNRLPSSFYKDFPNVEHCKSTDEDEEMTSNPPQRLLRSPYVSSRRERSKSVKPKGNKTTKPRSDEGKKQEEDEEKDSKEEEKEEEEEKEQDDDNEPNSPGRWAEPRSNKAEPVPREEISNIEKTVRKIHGKSSKLSDMMIDIVKINTIDNVTLEIPTSGLIE